MESFRRYLSHFPNYKPELFEDIYPLLSIKEVKAGDYLLSHGRICREIFFIDRGLLRLYYLANGKEVTNCFCKEDSIATSYSSLITQKPSEIAIQAIETSTIYTLSNDSLHDLYRKNAFWQQLGRLAAENEFIAAECHNRFITDLPAMDRYRQVLEEDGDLLQRVPLVYLATYLQIAPETLSRIRKKLSRT